LPKQVGGSVNTPIKKKNSEDSMSKKTLRLLKLSLPLLLLLLLLAGCQSSETKSSGGAGSGAGSGSGGTSGDQPAHGQATINLMEQNVFSGDNLNTAYWAQLEGYCKAGPTRLIVADMGLVPSQMSRSGFEGRWGVQLYALASTYAGVGWSPGDVAELQWFYENQDRLFAWWDRYINAILGIMQKYPQTTALIVINDEPDRCGARLGYAIQSRLGSVNNRVELGQVLDYWRKLR
jgi:hypothetical protein